MGRFYGTIGYGHSTEVAPDVWKDVITERNYYGDVLRNARRLSAGEHLNDNVEINNTVSIVADPYAFENFGAIRYVVWRGAKWKVPVVEEQYPRLILTIGGVYNDSTPSTP